MFTTIAWATDGSASASDALPVAEGLTRATGGKLVIIHVQEVTISRSGFLAEDSAAVLDGLHRTVRRFRDDGIDATVLSSRTTTRNVPRKILDLVSAARADVLVIGNRGHGPVFNLLLGRTAIRLLHGASLPIIAVPSRSATPSLAEASMSTWIGVQPAQPGHPTSHQHADLAGRSGVSPVTPRPR
ncbi:universal stress protein [Actinoplanes sp. NPDC048967]|uniref:universal stress protein n=1 Tax=Actinoplanes sp. NPDC048967 TaxID=3155269 RepID=UPI0033DA57D5